jgi:aminoglycoside phosphotransferase (APT) family kinase protein
MTGWVAAAPSHRRLAGTVGRAAAHTLLDRRVRRVTRLSDVPPRLEAITPAWLSAALGAEVRAVRVKPASSATSVRAVLELDGDPSLPPTLFAKSTPTLVTRLANGASATSLAEARFMMELRPLLSRELEIPWGHYCAADPRTFRSVQLLEDLVATRDAQFADVRFAVDRARADDAIDLLADVHRAFAGAPLPGWLRTQPAWWTMATELADLRRSNDRFLAGPDAPAALADPDRVWRAFERSVALHAELPSTLIHSDVHLANWYVTGDGRMGLCDWQCVSAGHWSLDVAYALTTLLAIEDRRAWEQELVARYLERSGATESADEAFLRYRQQIPGALLKWSPTLHRPAGFPEMQPPELARELLRRIMAAMTDLDVLEALA